MDMSNDELLQILIEQKDLLSRIDERTERTAEQLEEIAHSLYGNGKPGVLTTVAVLDTRLSTVEERDRENRIPRSVWIAIAVSLLVGIGDLVSKLL